MEKEREGRVTTRDGKGLWVMMMGVCRGNMMVYVCGTKKGAAIEKERERKRKKTVNLADVMTELTCFG